MDDPKGEMGFSQMCRSIQFLLKKCMKVGRRGSKKANFLDVIYGRTLKGERGLFKRDTPYNFFKNDLRDIKRPIFA